MRRDHGAQAPSNHVHSARPIVVIRKCIVVAVIVSAAVAENVTAIAIAARSSGSPAVET